ncbi:MAG: response regulator [Planctomycetes bacterium]|nr:response regulator [Planctomycetota bacterium]
MSDAISILVIDDDARIRLALEYNLKMDGFDIYQAKDGEEGYRIALKKSPDLILLDWMMPEMDGMETLRMLKGHYETRDIPVFMLTAKDTIGDIDEAMALGADDYMTKPFVVSRLGNIIRKKLEKLEEAE